ncbi:MAG: endonuclease/exonuclease/phosphatase family protein [Comamonadaceae bacterium]|nr:endonuclease/exonuclease/phosphatase family protein [Comamonadaceae bacterium]
MSFLLWTLSALAGFLIIATLLPWLKSPAWWVRIWDFPRLQLALLSLLGSVGTAVSAVTGHWEWGLQLVFFLTLLYQAWWILPYTPLFKREVMSASPGTDDPHLRVMACNVLTPNRNARALIDLVQQHRPDVLVTLETDAWWQQQLQPLEQDYPYRITCPLDNLYGMHVYSRLKLSDEEITYLVEPDVPSIHASVHVTDSLVVRMHFLHPAPPSPTENEESTERDVELLLIAKSLQEEKGPVIVTGDLNDVAWSPTTRMFRKISRLLDPRVGRGMYNSFHANYFFARWPLDHFFHSDHFQVVEVARLPSIDSDHFPVLLEVQYHPANADLQEGLEVESKDKVETAEFLAEEGADVGDVPRPDSKG